MMRLSLLPRLSSLLPSLMLRLVVWLPSKLPPQLHLLPQLLPQLCHTPDTHTVSMPSMFSEPTPATATLLVCPTLPTHTLVSQSLLPQQPRLKSPPSQSHVVQKSKNVLNLF